MNIKELNANPLNQAALERLTKEREDELSGLIHLLALAYLGLLGEDGEPVDPFSPEGKVMMDWSQTVGMQAAALENLEDTLDYDEILELPLAKLAERIVGALRGASGR